MDPSTARTRGAAAAAPPSPAVYVATFAFAGLAWTIAASLWDGGERAFAISAALVGLSLGPCLAGYAGAPPAQKPLQRRLVLITGGLSVLAPSLLSATSLDLEGALALLFVGATGAALGHTLVTVVAGPLVFGRVLCGWGCWRAMVLELLPVGRGADRRRGGAGLRRRGVLALLPYAGLTGSVAAAALLSRSLVPAAGFAGPAHTRLLPVAAACGAYYVVSVGLALALRDQRAFCKLVCPSGAILRVTSRPAALRIRATGRACDGCGACTRACPMGLDVAAVARDGRRLASGDCVLCRSCVLACTRGALALSFR